jgi:2-aminoethylphosphonate-pyruvate transaminase
MHSSANPDPARDKRLFTPGPLTTSLSVKQAMLHDPGSRDTRFIALIQSIREQLLALAGVSTARGFEAIPMQGSGTFAVESVLSSVIPSHGKLLVLVNGAYGERMTIMADRHGMAHRALRSDEDHPADPRAVEAALTEDAAITHVAAVHCETTSGMLNPAGEIGRIVHRHGKGYIVDAMSSFGAIPLDLEASGVDYLISSANKCLEGVPGFAFIIARREALTATEGLARTLSLDLLDQWRGLEKTGQFRFTPPTHALLAFAQALKELQDEGGVAGRGARYQANHWALLEGMIAQGFRPYLKPANQSGIITAFHYPASPQFKFEEFYARLADKGFLIYPGKLTRAACFRVGTIGRLDTADIRDLLQAVAEVTRDMGIHLEN